MSHNQRHWSDRAPAMLQDSTGPQGEQCSTSLDRRWLWRLETHLAVSATSEHLRDLRRDLAAYLHETCVHHWQQHVECAPPVQRYRQCTWCDHVEEIEETR